MKRYDKKTIGKACRMYQKGVPVRQILRETGITSHSVVLFHCDPEKKRVLVERMLAWRKKNPEKWGKIARKAAKKYQRKHKNS